MKAMKKFFVILFALLTVICLVGCGTYTPPAGGRPSFGGGSGNKPGDGPNKPPEEKSVFTVTLINGPATLPEDMQAVWTKSNNEVHTAPFIDNVATIEGLDGDYHVTLTDLPDGYTYDCNGYIAGSDQPDITVELLKIIPLKTSHTLTPSRETQEIRWYDLSDYGTYRARLNDADSVVGFMFAPSENGSFSVTSWCDATANEINPVFRHYHGHQQFCVFEREYDDGGSSSTFTKNFRFEADFGDENVGSVLIFTIRASVNAIEYPVDVDFTIKRESSYQLPDYSGIPYYANGPFCTNHETGAWRYIYEDNTRIVQTANGRTVTYNIQDESKVVFNHDDGFYHVGAVDGPLLYAKLTKDCQVFISYDSLSQVWYNIGFTWNTTFGGMISLILDGYDYAYMVNQGYAKYCDGNGAHPVTEELKNFLQSYASRENLFKDGEGWAEDAKSNANSYTNPGGLYLQSDESSMWLFACGYYRR